MWFMASRGREPHVATKTGGSRPPLAHAFFLPLKRRSTRARLRAEAQVAEQGDQRRGQADEDGLGDGDPALDGLFRLPGLARPAHEVLLLRESFDDAGDDRLPA